MSEVHTLQPSAVCLIGDDVVFKRHETAESERGTVVGRTCAGVRRFDIETETGERVFNLAIVQRETL